MSIPLDTQTEVHSSHAYSPVIRSIVGAVRPRAAGKYQSSHTARFDAAGVPYVISEHPSTLGRQQQHSQVVLIVPSPYSTTSVSGTRVVFFFCFFSIPFIIFALLFSLPPTVVVTQIRGNIEGSHLPLPTTVRALHFLSREDFSSFFPRRLESNCAYPR